MKHIHVACAIIYHEGAVFAARRGDDQKLAGYWEFPGGKLETGESPEECIVREMMEELSMNVTPIRTIDHVVHDYEDLRVSLYPVICTLHVHDYILTEHSDAGWFDQVSALELKWAPADIPILDSIFTANEEGGYALLVGESEPNL